MDFLTRKFVFRTVVILGLLYILFWLPWFAVRIFTTDVIHYSINNLPHADTAIVFGGLYHPNQEITETNRERLLAAKLLLDSKKVDSIVISNTEQAAIEMERFLLREGIEENKIIIDSNAIVTLDTCKNQKARNSEDAIIFVSHDYHLPRIIYQCKKVNVAGIGFTPDELNLIERNAATLADKLQTKFLRNQREAFLTLASFLGIY